MRKILPILIATLGVGAGVGAGLALRSPAPSEVTLVQNPCGPDPNAAEHQSAKHNIAQPAKAEDQEYVKLNNQFIIPVVEKGKVSSMVIISLSLEVAKGQKESVFAREPKLRNAFLQVMFDHANIGGFTGAFTNSGNLNVLRSALLEVGRDAIGHAITDVLITDIARQDT